jgi:hypothetical protein
LCECEGNIRGGGASEPATGIGAELFLRLRNEQDCVGAICVLDTYCFGSDANMGAGVAEVDSPLHEQETGAGVAAG